MTTYPIRTRRWTRAEYDRLIDVGILRPGDPVELLGGERDYSGEHPARPVLVIEVSDSSLALDRERKGSLYARAGLEDYRIVNVVERVLEIYREPVADPSAIYGWRYASRTVLGPDASASPLAAPTAAIVVHALLP